jgi:hypothetical protein
MGRQLLKKVCKKIKSRTSFISQRIQISHQRRRGLTQRRLNKCMSLPYGGFGCCFAIESTQQRNLVFFYWMIRLLIYAFIWGCLCQKCNLFISTLFNCQPILWIYESRRSPLFQNITTITSKYPILFSQVNTYVNFLLRSSIFFFIYA